jgi:predicted SAM-dependent methyltransferase
VSAAAHPTKLNIGCGHDVRPGWVNHDVAPLAGVDVVHDLKQFPWPFPDAAFTEIEMINVLEHLPETVRTMEELHRIAAPGCRLTIRVPFWNSPDAITDPTHAAQFNEHSFDYFDPETRHGKERGYYSSARFRIERIDFWVRVAGRYLRVTRGGLKPPLAFLARHFGGVIWVQEAILRALK